jgi:hypothetical protein
LAARAIFIGEVLKSKKLKIGGKKRYKNIIKRFQQQKLKVKKKEMKP